MIEISRASASQTPAFATSHGGSKGPRSTTSCSAAIGARSCPVFPGDDTFWPFAGSDRIDGGDRVDQVNSAIDGAGADAFVSVCGPAGPGGGVERILDFEVGVGVMIVSGYDVERFDQVVMRQTGDQAVVHVDAVKIARVGVDVSALEADDVMFG